MKFAAALTVLLWLSLIAQVFGDYFIEIAGENPKDKSKGVKTRKGAVELDDEASEDAQSCKSNTEGNPPGLMGGLYKCTSLDVAFTDGTKGKEVQCVMAPEDNDRFRYFHKTVKQQAWHGASFFMISGAQLNEYQILTFNGHQVETLPTVMMIGFSQQHPDSPGFLQELTCTKRNDIATAPVFKPYLPPTEKEVAALTALFCCNDPIFCYDDSRAKEREEIMKSVNIVIDNISKSMREKDYLRIPISSKQLQPSGSLQKSGSPKKSGSFRSESGRKAVKRSESMPDGEVQLKASTSMRNMFKWGSRAKWSFRHLLGSKSGRRSGTVSPAEMSRSDSMNSEMRDIELEPEEPAAATLSPKRLNELTEEQKRERAKAEERVNLHILIKIMLNSVIDPCYLLYIKRQGKLSRETKQLITDNCRRHCTLMARAAEIGGRSYGNRGCNRLALYTGNCDDKLKSCLCGLKKETKETVTDRVRGTVERMISKWQSVKMTYCNNQVRNHLAPISQCT